MKIFFKKNKLLTLYIIIFSNTYKLSAKPFEREIEDIGTAFQFIIVPTIAGTRALYDEKESFNQFLWHYLTLNGSVHLMKLIINKKDQVLIDMNLFHLDTQLPHLVEQLLCILDILLMRRNIFT